MKNQVAKNFQKSNKNKVEEDKKQFLKEKTIDKESELCYIGNPYEEFHLPDTGCSMISVED